MPPEADDAAALPDPDLPSRIIRLADQQGRRALDFTLAPDAAGRAAVARALAIPGVRKLGMTGRLIPTGRRDWRLEAVLGATVVQDCVVTLAPVTTRIDEPVLRVYCADLPPPGPGEVEMPEDDTVEALPATLDLAAVMIEALALALPGYPRAPDASLGAGTGAIAVTAPGVAPLDAEAVRPFAGLKDALARRAGDDTA